jgi:hypothetical protein
MSAERLVRDDVTRITPEIALQFSTLDCYELILPSVATLTPEDIQCFSDRIAPQIITFPAVSHLPATVALELANGVRSQWVFPAVTALDRCALRALASWKRGWISFPELTNISANPEHLELALHCGNLSIVRLLIEQAGFSPNHLFRNRLVPILIAGQHLNAALIRLLIELGADANHQSHKDGDTILHIACRARSNGLINYLIDHVNLTIRNLNGRIPYDEYLDDDPIREKLVP